MIVTKKSKFLLVFLISLSFPILAANTGRLTFKIGKVQKKIASGPWQNMRRGDLVRSFESVRTLKGATAIFVLPGGHRIKLRSNSIIRLDSLVPKKGRLVTKIQLESGGIFAKVVRKNNREVFQIKALTHVAGVRGTQFFVALEPLKNSQQDSLLMCVNKGIIVVTDKKNKQKVNINTGEGIVIDKKSKLPKPRKLKWLKKFNWNMNEKAGDVVDTTNIKKVYQTAEPKKYSKDFLDLEYD